jgi:diguanylate cyclase (GGDEF)-like protein
MDTATIKTDAAGLIAAINPVIAVVDDDDVFRQYLAVLFKSINCRVVEAACGGELMDLLWRQHVDCIVLDYDLIAENGLSIHAQIRDQFLDPPPVLMLTVERNERTIIKAFRGGVSDYVLKSGLTSEELFKAMHSCLERRADMRARDEELARLKSKSEFDDATGLYHRKAIDQRLGRMAETHAHGRFAVMLVSVQNVDAVAAKFGEVVADRVWRSFVMKLKKAFGPNMFGGRYDDARFIAITDVDVREKSVESTCARLASELSFDVNLDVLSLSIAASIGAAIYPLHGRDVAQVLASAEAALTKAGAGEFAMASPRSAEPADGVAVGAGPAVESPDADRNKSMDATILRHGERRSVARQRVLKRGQIILRDLCSAMDCTIRDLSHQGARLRVEGHFIAPTEFALLLPATRETRRARVCWQNGNDIGVQFVE